MNTQEKEAGRMYIITTPGNSTKELGTHELQLVLRHQWLLYNYKILI
jgi:hypothetical protein